MLMTESAAIKSRAPVPHKETINEPMVYAPGASRYTPNTNRSTRALSTRHVNAMPSAQNATPAAASGSENGKRPPPGKIRQRRQLIRNARVADLGLRAHDPLGHRRRPGEKCARDFLSRQAADLA